MLNLAAPFIIDFFTDALKSVLPYADIVVGNETEGQAFGKKFFDTVSLPDRFFSNYFDLPKLTASLGGLERNCTQISCL